MVAAVLLGLLRVRVRVEVTPAATVAGLKDLVSVGATGAVTVRVATAAEPQLPLLVLRPPAAMELTYVPAAVAVTVAVTVQDPPAGMEPPLSMTLEEPFAPVSTPPQVVVPSAETVSPLGNASTRAEDREAAMLLALLRVRVRVEVPPVVMLAGLKDLASDGTTMALTVSVATAAEELLPLLVLRAAAARELR
jgi:hypothetical protein